MMRRLSAVLLLSLALAVPAAAEDFAFRGFGVHAGAGFSPGQLFGQVTVTGGDFNRLRLVAGWSF